MFQPHVDEDPRLNEFREAKTFPVLRNLASIGTDTEGPTVSVRSASAKPTFRRQYSSKSELNTVPSVSSALSKQRMKKNPTLKSLASKIRMEHGDAVGGVTSPKRRTLQQSMQHLRSLQASSVETLDPMPAMQKSLIEERMKTKRVYAARFSAAVRKLDPPAPLEERILREQRRHRKLTDEQVLQQALEKLATKAKHWDRGWVGACAPAQGNAAGPMRSPTLQLFPGWPRAGGWVVCPKQCGTPSLKPSNKASIYYHKSDWKLLPVLSSASAAKRANHFQLDLQ